MSTLPDGLYIGIDGGATRATALVTTHTGWEVARAEGAAGLVRPSEPAATVPTLEALITKAIAAANTDLPVQVVCCALAGAGREPARSAVQHGLAGKGIAHHVLMTTDAEAALEDAFPSGGGILLISGTGSIAWARTPRGQLVRTGGWGSVFGDEGSAHLIGQAALRAVARAADGRGSPTILGQEILHHAGVEGTEDLIGWADGAGKPAVAALAPLVFAAADATPQDDVALAIVRGAALDLARHVEALLIRYGPWPRPAVALAGGLLFPGRPFRETVEAAIRRIRPECVISPVAVDGARGAATLARKHVRSLG